MTKQPPSVDTSIIDQDDTILITGTAGDGNRYVDLRAVVATVADDAIKVWPVEADAKLWFESHNIESFTVVMKAE